LISEGEPISLVARYFDVTNVTLNRWLKESQSQCRPIVSKNKGGRPRRLSESQLCQLEQLLLQGAAAHGWSNNLWTSKRVNEVIRRHFDTEFHPLHVCRILKNYLHWTRQKPVNRLRDRNETEIAQWKSETIKHIEAAATRRSAFLVFVDESGFMLAPTVRHTFAPRGQTPVNRICDPHARISVIGAIAVSPIRRQLRFRYHLLQDNANFRGEEVMRFIGQLERSIAAPMTLIWDSIPIHRACNLWEYIRKRSTLRVKTFPPYASELNPVDGVWAYVKYDRLPNFAPSNLGELRIKLRYEFSRVRKHQRVLRHCVRRTGLALDGFS
jgi:transposase